LEFRLGPRSAPPAGEPTDLAAPSLTIDQQRAALAPTVAAAISEVAQQDRQRLVIVYAPATPSLSRPLSTAHADDPLFELISERLQAAEIAVVDLRDDFVRLWQTQRRLPRGFHNGQPGSGHLNADGNRLIAEAIVAATQERLSRLTPPVAEMASR